MSVLTGGLSAAPGDASMPRSERTAMLQTPPAQPGMREDEIDTPALVIDLDAFEANLDRMAALLAPTGARLRAHAKTHKSPVIARLQMARGAIGQCVQKVAEAE